MELLLAFYFFTLNLGGNPSSFDSTTSPYENQAKLSSKYENMTREERLLDAIRYYRKIGFFGEYQTKTDQELYQILNNQLEQEWTREGDPFNPDYRVEYAAFADLYLLGMDQKNTWMEDLEADVAKGNQVYVETLNQWKEISKGAFPIQNITETWQGEEGPVVISFELEGKKHTIYAEFQSDFIDLGILPQINERIQSSGYQFELAGMDQTAFVTCLTSKVKEQIEQDRGIVFEKLE